MYMFVCWLEVQGGVGRCCFPLLLCAELRSGAKEEEEEAFSEPALLLIIPIIMARYENVINNTEDIVVAISHMVVGLCSVTILPLASTYVCQEHASMTSPGSAHLALSLCPPAPPLPKTHLSTAAPRVKPAGEMLISSEPLRHGEFFMPHPVGLGTSVR